MIGKGFIVRPQQRECRLMCRPLLHSYTELRVPVPTVTSIKSDGKDILSVTMVLNSEHSRADSGNLL
jgi:hypothetical protein